MEAIFDDKPIEQTGFRAGKNCLGEVPALTSHIDAGLNNGVQTATVNLTVVIDIGWDSLLYKSTE